MSEPSDKGPKPAASAADEPPDEPPGRPRPVPRIVGRAVNVVVALPVAQDEGHVGFAEDDGPGALEARDRERVLFRDKIPGGGYAPGGRQSGDVIRFLDRDGHAEERPALAARQGRIGLPGRFAGAREVTHRHGVEIPVEALDSGDELVGQLESRDLLLQ